jgi:hypothetical protein
MGRQFASIDLGIRLRLARPKGTEQPCSTPTQQRGIVPRHPVQPGVIQATATTRDLVGYEDRPNYATAIRQHNPYTA